MVDFCTANASKRLSEKSPYLFPTRQIPCHHHRTPAAGWIANVCDQAGGRPLGVCRNVRQGSKGGGGHRGSAGGRVSFETRAKPATGPGCVSRQPKGEVWNARPVRACGGHDAPSVRQGPCRYPETHSRGLSRLRPEQSGREVTSVSARCRLSDADIIRQDSGRARAAPPIYPFLEAKPACGPPDQSQISSRWRPPMRGFWRG